MISQVPGQLLWQLFVALHPILKKSLPKNVHGEQSRLSTYNYITNVRHEIRAIPLSFPDDEWDQTKLDGRDFSQSLRSLLEVIETVVSDNIFTDFMGQTHDLADAPERTEKLRSEFPHLMTVWSVLGNLTMNSNRSSSPSEPQRHLMERLAGYIHFFHPQQQGRYDLAEVAKRLREFRSMANKVFRDPIKALEQNTGNSARLMRDEISFVQRAYHLNSLSRKLFSLLVGSLSCSGVHDAQLHLSGFLASDVDFELFIADCKEESWNYAKCRWDAPVHAAKDCCRPEHIVCSQHSSQASPKQISLAFDQDGLWNGWDPLGEVDTTYCPSSDPTLQELLLGERRDTNLQAFKLKAKEKQTLELVIACSLLNLYTSHWIRVGLGTDKISVRMSEEASDLLARWKPHITCPLHTVDEDYDDNTAVLDFGILLMEMEAGQAAEATESDMDWDGSGISKDSMLKRILEEWADDVEDEYKDIASACLLFRQLSERFYDPQLEQDTKRTGAIYKYILAPLFRLVTRKFRESLQLFAGIPKPVWSRSISSSHGIGQFGTTTDLKLFDGSVTISPTQQNINDATKFMTGIGRFANMIEDITQTSTIPTFATWKADRIRIAILDTGIDIEDVLVEAAREDNRIKECFGFVNGSGMDPDPDDYHDFNSHGTHVTRLVLNAAPSAEILIAKVSDQSTVAAHDLHRIARAIKWATKMKANIISMSLGLDIRDTEIDMAIQAAVNANISIFAASSNEGGNKTRAWPARRSHGVICIHASDGKGNNGEINPTPLVKGDNFTTLGIAIPSKWKGSPLSISGTSFSTPIAAALAADVLEFARHRCSLSKHQQDKLHRYDGVRQVLALMLEEGAGTRGGYDYVWPFHLWKPGQSDEKIAECIVNIADA